MFLVIKITHEIKRGGGIEKNIKSKKINHKTFTH